MREPVTGSAPPRRGQLTAGRVDVGAPVAATVALTPGATRRSRKARTPRRRRAPVGQPGVGLSGMRFTWAGERERSAARASSAASLSRSLTPSISAHSKLSRRPLASQVAGARRHEVVERVAPVDRDQLVAEHVVGGVQRHREVDRQGGGGQAVDAGDDADGRDREVAGRQAEVVVEALDRGPDPVEVGQRLAHAHEHHVGQPPAQRRGPRAAASHHLLDDLARRSGAG